MSKLWLVSLGLLTLRPVRESGPSHLQSKPASSQHPGHDALVIRTAAHDVFKPATHDVIRAATATHGVLGAAAYDVSRTAHDVKPTRHDVITAAAAADDVIWTTHDGSGAAAAWNDASAADDVIAAVHDPFTTARHDESAATTHDDTAAGTGFSFFAVVPAVAYNKK
jgi:hypothetical protein